MDSREITIGNLRIHTLVAGSEQYPPLLLLHGYPVSSQLWRHIMPALAERFRVWAPDLPGHGLSEKPDVDYDLDLLVGFLLGFTKALGEQPVAVVGHDLGAMAALGFAARHPQRVSRLVIMDTAPYADWSLSSRILIGLLKIPALSRLLLARPVFRGLLQLAVAHPRAITSEIAELYRRPWIADADGRRAFSQTVAMPPERVTEPRANLSRISMPVLVLWAQKDRLFGKRLARRLRDDLPDATMTVVPDCGHFLQEEQPRLIIEHLQDFLVSAAA